ncbi:MAG: hypothetical protein ACXAB4_10150 [Candidatus Hodarchaeales archaeon]
MNWPKTIPYSQSIFNSIMRLRILPIELLNPIERLQPGLAVADVVLFLIPFDCFQIFDDCSKFLLSLNQYLDPSTPLILLLAQPDSDCFIPLTIAIEEVHLEQLAAQGFCHLGIYSICMQTGEGLQNVLRDIESILLEKFY